METDRIPGPSPEDRRQPNNAPTPPHPHGADLFGNPPHYADGFRSMPTDADPIGTLPHDAEPLGNPPHLADAIRSVPTPADPLRTVPGHEEDGDRPAPGGRELDPEGEELRGVIDRGDSAAAERERRDSYALTVRDAMRLFEAHGVPRCERTISQWCRRNRHGERRLEAYYDEGERRYRITEASVVRAIAEERAKLTPGEIDPPPERTRETTTSTPKRPEAEDSDGELAKLKAENLNLQIDNRAKEQVIAQFAREREELLERAQAASHRIGSLETELRLIGMGTGRDRSDHADPGVDNSRVSDPRPW